MISRPYNVKAQTEMIGDKHLIVAKSLPFKKFRYKLVFNAFGDSKPNFDFLDTQSQLGTMRLSYTLRRYLNQSGERYHWWFGNDYVYIEDEATTSMASLLYSDIIKKIYIYKTYEEMSGS